MVAKAGRMNTLHILTEVVGERVAQDAKWGEQNHPDLSSRIFPPQRPEFMDRANYRQTVIAQTARYYGIPTADQAREACDNEHKRGQGSWFTIHIEELAEAMEAAVLGDTVAMRRELVQTIATLTAHVEAIDRRAQ